MSDLVGNPRDQFSRVAAHTCILIEILFVCFVAELRSQDYSVILGQSH